MTILEAAIKTQVTISKAQLELLNDIVKRPRFVAEYYQPAKKLIADQRAIFVEGILHPTIDGENLIRKLSQYQEEKISD